MSVPRALQADNQVQYAKNASLTIPQYSLMYMEVDDVRPAASIADQLTEEANQRYFASRFVGVAGLAKVSTDPAETLFPVFREFVGDFDCVSGTFEVGDLVTIDEDSGGTFLTNDKLVKTLDPTLAIGQCIKREASAVTTVRVKLTARAGSVVGNVTNAFAALHSFPMGNGLVNTETLSGTKTIAVGDPTIQILDPGGAGRNCDLPAEESSIGSWFWIRNAADAAEVLTVRNDAGTTICTPTQNESALCICIPTVGAPAWIAIATSHN